MTPKAKVTREKIHNLDFIKVKNFCAASNIIKRVKRQPTEWEKIFANHISDKRLVCRICKELIIRTRKTQL